MYRWFINDIGCHASKHCLSDSDVEKENSGFIISYFFELRQAFNIIFSKSLESFKWVLILSNKDIFYECKTDIYAW